MQPCKIYRAAVCFLVLLAFASSGLCASAKQSDTDGQPASRPKAVFDSLRHDFGTVMEGERIVHDFMVTNAGSAPLVIKNIQPD